MKKIPLLLKANEFLFKSNLTQDNSIDIELVTKKEYVTQIIVESIAKEICKVDELSENKPLIDFIKMIFLQQHPNLIDLIVEDLNNYINNYFSDNVQQLNEFELNDIEEQCLKYLHYYQVETLIKLLDFCNKAIAAISIKNNAAISPQRLHELSLFFFTLCCKYYNFIKPTHITLNTFATGILEHINTVNNLSKLEKLYKENDKLFDISNSEGTNNFFSYVSNIQQLYNLLNSLTDKYSGNQENAENESFYCKI